jgi:hypothetical protein
VGGAAVACTGALAGLPLARADGGLRDGGLRVAVLALVVLVAALAGGWPSLVPVPLLLVGGIYGVELAADDAPLDVAAPAFAAGLLVAAELCYWSIEEQDRVKGGRGDDLRRLALVAALGIAALLVCSVLVALADEIRARGLGVDVAGAVAAALALLAVVLFGRGRRATGE